MRVYLIRHADAIPDSDEINDDTRWLSTAGRHVASRVGASLASAGVTFDAVLTSPLVRAVQTAELIAAATAYAGEIVAADALRPSALGRAFLEELDAVGTSIALIGHEPSISALGSLLCARQAFPAFRKGEVMLVDDGKLAFRLDPNTLQIAPG